MHAGVPTEATLSRVTMAVILAIELATALVVIGAARPAIGLRLWVVVTAAFPCWLGFSVPLLNFVTPATLAGLPLLLGLGLKGLRMRMTTWDLGLAVCVALGFVAVIGYGSRLSEAKALALGWGIPYLLGRYAGSSHAQSVGRFVAHVGAAVGGLGILELMSGIHPFTHLGTGSPLGFWAAVQQRGGLDRSEGAFGHSIALGAFLVACAPFVINYLQGRDRVVCLLLVSSGVLSTLSRGPMLGLVAVMLLTLIPGRRLAISGVSKAKLGWVLGAVGVAVVPLAIHVGNASQDELATSAQYRTNLTSLVGLARPIGLAENAIWSDRLHEYTFLGYGSIDESFLAIALSLGYLISLALILAVLVFALRWVNGRTGPAAISILSQVPLFLTVALITQWMSFVWFFAGWAVSETTRLSTRGEPLALESALADSRQSSIHRDATESKTAA